LGPQKRGAHAEHAFHLGVRRKQFLDGREEFAIRLVDVPPDRELSLTLNIRPGSSGRSPPARRTISLSRSEVSPAGG
jgi:hypothetical protein